LYEEISLAAARQAVALEVTLPTKTIKSVSLAQQQAETVFVFVASPTLPTYFIVLFIIFR
jgi:hypothetical protein